MSEVKVKLKFILLLNLDSEKKLNYIRAVCRLAQIGAGRGKEIGLAALGSCVRHWGSVGDEKICVTGSEQVYLNRKFFLMFRVGTERTNAHSDPLFFFFFQP